MTVQKILCYDELGPDGNHHVELTESEAINQQKKQAAKNGAAFTYEDDEEALLDFITINWAYYKE